MSLDSLLGIATCQLIAVGAHEHNHVSVWMCPCIVIPGGNEMHISDEMGTTASSSAASRSGAAWRRVPYLDPIENGLPNET